MVVGNYVKTFAEASHALPDGMHMNADYPLMIPRIESLDGKTIRIKADRYPYETFEAKIQKGRDGREFCTIAQSSTFESLFHRKPTRFRFDPFKDQNTPAIGDAAPSLFPSEPLP
jgi:hypothetical protein